jgi:DNA (cytosine-5)-methyltransferase 1
VISNHVAGRLSALDEEVVRAVPPGGNWRDLPADFASKRIDQIRASAARGEGSRSTYYGRLRWDRPSYTISTYFSRPGNGCFIHPEAPRLITVREAARLQSFPDHFRFVGSGRRPLLQVGNAVPPLLALQLAKMYEPGSMVDLFSGVGGLSLGFEWAGFELIAASDNDEAANEALRTNGHRSRDPVIAADLGEPDEHSAVMREIKNRLSGRLDVLIGGSPCQGFSTAGFGRMNDPRNKLLFAFIAAVEQLRPRNVIMENVPALMWRRRLPFLAAIIHRLEALGYLTTAKILHAEGYGVPQLRRRLFVAGSLDHEVAWPQPWRRILDPAQLEHQPGATLNDQLDTPVTVRDAISDLPAAAAPSPTDLVEYASPPTSDYQRWARGEVGASAFVGEPTRIRAQETLFAAA